MGWEVDAEMGVCIFFVFDEWVYSVCMCANWSEIEFFSAMAGK